jgi:hypothetical protein
MLVWPASFAVARSYVDQLARGKGLSADRLARISAALDRAEKASAAERQSALSALGTELNADAQTASDQPRVQKLAGVVGELARRG